MIMKLFNSRKFAHMLLLAAMMTVNACPLPQFGKLSV